MVYSIFILFIIYTLACIADGPDIKPKINNYLYDLYLRRAYSLRSFQLCDREWCKQYLEYLEETRVPFGSQVVTESIKITEYETYFGIINIKAMAKEEAIHRILHKIRPFIRIREVKLPYDYSTYIKASIIINSKDT